MNLMFEAENAPQRWELLYNGKRPTVVFRYLPELQSVTQPARPLDVPKKERRIVFAGDLIGDAKPGGIALEQIAKTVLDVCGLALDRPASQLSDLLKVHKEAQLFIITGTQEEIKVVTDALSALSQKLRLETRRKAQPASEESKTKSEATKSP